MTAPAAEALKRAAAEAAAALVEDGMVVGLGTGSTAALALTALGARVAAGLAMTGVPTSERTAALARSLGIKLAGLGEHPRLDLAIDGADEVARGSLAMIKGLGGALLREKIVASASDRLVIVIDESKLVPRLGGRSPVPVEVVPFGWEATLRRLAPLGARPRRRLDAAGGAFVTDNGNYILDCAFPIIADPADLADRIKRQVGVVESGLFIGMAERVLVGTPGGVTVLTPP